MKGRVKLFSLERGYGFIKPDGGGADVYVTRMNVEKPKGLLRPGDYVVFQVQKQKGQPQAVFVKRLKEDGTEDDAGEWVSCGLSFVLLWPSPPLRFLLQPTLHPLAGESTR